MSQAGDANRTDYNLANTCATQAIKAIIAGLGVTNYAEAVARSSGHWLNPMNWVREGQKLIQSRGWSLVPGSSQTIGRVMSNLGSTNTY